MSGQTSRHLLVINQGHCDHNLPGTDPELSMESLQIETPAKDGRKRTRRMMEKRATGRMVAEMLGSVESQCRFGK